MPSGQRLPHQSLLIIAESTKNHKQNKPERYKLGTSYHKTIRLTDPFAAGGWAVLNRHHAYYVHRFPP